MAEWLRTELFTVAAACPLAPTLCHVQAGDILYLGVLPAIAIMLWWGSRHG